MENLIIISLCLILPLIIISLCKFINSLKFYNDPVVIQDTIKSGQSGRVEYDWGGQLVKSRVKNAFLTWLLTNIEMNTAKSHIVRQYYLRGRERSITVANLANATAPGNAMTITLANANQAKSCQVGSLLTVRGVNPANGESVDLQVQSVSGSTITVLANNRTKGIPALPADTSIFIRTTSYAQGAGKVEPVGVKAGFEEEPTQIFRNPYGCSRTVENENVFGVESERSVRRAEAELAHLEDIEFAKLLNGDKYIIEADETNGVNRGTFTGLIRWIVNSAPMFNNMYEYQSGSFDFNQFKNLMTRLFFSKRVDGNQKKRVALCNIAMLDFFWTLQNDNIVKITNDKIFGNPVNTLSFAGGDIVMVESPLLTEFFGNTTNDPVAAFIHPRYLRRKPLKNRNTKLITNIHDNGDDKFMDEILTETTLLKVLPEMFAVCGPNGFGVLS